MRSRAWLAWSAFAALALAGGACSKPKSFIVLDLYSVDAREIQGVTEVDVEVSQPSSSLDKKLTYPVKNSGMLAINQVNVNDLSVSFTGGRSGPVTLNVDVFAGNCKVGTVQGATVIIRQGDIVSTSVKLEPLPSCTTADGGVDGQEGDAFPGCDPAQPGLVCAPTQTCQVNCDKGVGECTAGGTGGPGATCTKNLDCAPGLQCFDYSNTGCGVKICLHFCNDDKACGSGGGDAGAGQSASDGGADGGADGAAAVPTGPRSVCQGLVPCLDPVSKQQVITGYHTCTFACDPREAAVAANATKCPTGLACLVVGGMDQVDCACAEATRKGKDGDPCTGGTDCAPGYICNMMADTKVCRAICRCDAKDGACTAAGDCGNKACSALTNETTFGVCL